MSHWAASPAIKGFSSFAAVPAGAGIRMLALSGHYLAVTRVAQPLPLTALTCQRTYTAIHTLVYTEVHVKRKMQEGRKIFLRRVPDVCAVPLAKWAAVPVESVASYYE